MHNVHWTWNETETLDWPSLKGISSLISKGGRYCTLIHLIALINQIFSRCARQGGVGHFNWYRTATRFWPWTTRFRWLKIGRRLFGGQRKQMTTLNGSKSIENEIVIISFMFERFFLINQTGMGAIWIFLFEIVGTESVSSAVTVQRNAGNGGGDGRTFECIFVAGRQV